MYGNLPISLLMARKLVVSEEALAKIQEVYGDV